MTIALGTLAYGIAAGMSISAALYFAAIRVRQENADPMYTALALLSFVSAVGSVVAVTLHKSPSIDDYARHLKLFGFVSLIGLVTIVTLVAAWSRSVSRRAWVVFASGTVIIGGLHLSLPSGLFGGSITALREVHLLDESFVVHVGTPTSWRLALHVYLIAAAALIGIALVRGYRRADRGEAVLLAGTVILFMLTSSYDNLVDVGAVSTPYVTPFTTLLFVAAGSMLIARRMAKAQARLREQAADLERTVVSRTADLNRANEQLHQQLSRERMAVRRMETLTRQFASLNQLAVRSADKDEIRDSLQSLIEELGRLLHIAAVELRISGDDPTGLVPRRVTWSAAGRPGEATGQAAQSNGAADRLEVTERIAIGPRGLGHLAIMPRDEAAYGVDERRFAHLVAEQLAALIHRLELRDLIATSAVQEERSRIARELHDSVTQRLYAVAFLADALPRLQESQSHQVPGTIRRMKEIISSSLAELRVMLFELRPQTVDADHLPELIQQLTDGVIPNPDVQVRAMVEPVPHLPQHVALGFYRIAQEATRNAVRHSGSATVLVGLHNLRGTTRLTVSDDGVGFDPTHEPPGHGLHGLRERASLLGATLEIRSTPGVGTDIVVEWSADATAGSPEEPKRDRRIAGPDPLAGRSST